MARIARVVAVNIPHHVIQRGNRSQNVFFSDKDKKTYLKILKKYSMLEGLEIWAYCLMDNHVHLIVIPQMENSLAMGIGKVHKDYTRMINLRQGWRGFLWHGRFKSYPLDEQYLYTAVRYVERNPVRAGLVKRAVDYPWSSAKAHVFKEKNEILSDNFMISEIKDWASYLGDEDANIETLRKHLNTGRPLGDENFINKLENITGRFLKKKKPGPKKELSVVSP